MYNKIKCEGVIQLITNWNVLSGGLIFMLLEWHEILISFNSILITFLFRTRNRKLSFKKRREIISLDHPFNNNKENLLQRKSFFFFNLKKNKKNCATRKRTTLGNIKNHTKNVSTMNIKSNRIFLNFLDYRYIQATKTEGWINFILLYLLKIYNRKFVCFWCLEGVKFLQKIQVVFIEFVLDTRKMGFY